MSSYNMTVSATLMAKKSLRKRAFLARGIAALFIGGGLFSAATSSAYAQSGNWNVDAAGTWSNAANWNPAAVPGTVAGDIIGLNNNISAARTVTIDTTPRTVGILNIGDSNNTHAFTLAASGGATLTFDNSGSGAQINEAGSIADVISAPIILADNLNVTAAGSLTLSTGGISETGGARTLTKSGTGTLILSGANSYTGLTSVSAGVMNIQNATALGTVADGTTVAAGAALQIQNNITVGTEAISLSGTGITNTGALRSISGVNTYGGVITLGADSRINTDAGTLTLSAGITGANLNLTIGGTGNTTVSTVGITTGSGNLIKDGAGTLTLSAANTYTGSTTINAGTVAFASQASLYNNTPGSWTAANINAKAGATLAVNVDSAAAAGFDAGNLTTLLTNISVANSASSGLHAGAIVGINTSTATGATFTPASAIANSTGAFGGVISLNKLGTGTLVLDLANTYTGPTSVSGGTLELGSGAAGGSLSTSSPITIATGAIFSVNQSDTVTQGTDFSGAAISGAGSFTQAGTGTTVLNVANTFSGTTTVSAGTLTLSNARALQNSALVTTSGTSTIGAFNAVTIGGLSGATGDLGSANVLNGYTGNVTALTLNPQAGVSVTYGGVITNGSGNMTLTKTGAGTQTLTGANTYTGATIVNAGTLAIGVGGSLDSSSALQVSNGTFSYNNTSAGQTVNGLAVGAGNSIVNNTAAGQTLTLGAITRTASFFGTVNFATLTGPINTSTANTNSIIGPWATTGSTTTLRYAVGGGNISGLTGTTATAGTLANVTDATGNFEYSAAATTAADLTGNTLRYSGAAATTAIGAANTLTLNGLMQAGTGLLTISGGPSTGGILIGSTGELVIAANAQPTTISAAIGGTGRLVYNGGGTLLLNSATSSYTDGTVINAGQIRINSDAALGNASGSITLNGGSLLGNTTNPQAGNAGGINISSARDVFVGTTGGSIGAHGNNNFTTTGKLSGSGPLTMLFVGGAGGQRLNFHSTSNDFTGAIFVPSNAPTIAFNSLTDSSNNITFNGAQGGTFVWDSGAIAPLVLNNRSFQFSPTATGQTLTITNNNTAAANANTITVNTNLLVTGTGSATFALSGTNAGNNVFAGNIPNGSGLTIAVSKTAAGTWVLSGTNTYTGATSVAGGTLASTNPVQGFGTNLSGITLAGSTTLSLRNDSSVTFGVGATGYNINNSASAATINVDRVTGTGSNTISVGNLTTTSTAGSWQLNFTGDNGAGLNAGTLTTPLSTAATTHTISNNIVPLNGAALTLATINEPSTFATPILNFTGTGRTNVTGAITQTTSALAVTKNGAGTTALGGANTYLGTTSVNAGTLLLNGNNTAATGAVSVSALATLGGSGTVGGTTTVASTGIVAPGNSAGNLTFAAGLDLSAGGVYSWELGALSTSNPGIDFDTITVSGGNLALGGTSAVTLDFGLVSPNDPSSANVFWTTGKSWKIIDVTTGTNTGDTNISTITNASYSSGSFTTTVGTGGDAGDIFLVFTVGPPTWIGASGDNWTAGTSWTGSVPNSATAEARFSTAGGAIANLDVDQTVNKLTFNATTSNDYTISGPGKLTLAGGTPAISLAATNTGDQTVAVNLDLATDTTITVNGGSLSLDAPTNATLGSNVTATVASGATLNLGGAGNALSNGTTTHANVTNDGTLAATTAGKRVGNISGTGTTDVTATGATLTANFVRQAGLTIGAGNNVTVAANGTDTGVSTVTALSINATGQLDLDNNDLIVDNGNLAAVTLLLKTGLDITGAYGGGPGITSTTFATNPLQNTALGVATNAELGYTTFSGQTVDANDILVKYTYFGDADLNGVVDTATDFDLYITGLTSGGSLGGWLYGDFDYNGAVDSATDFDLYITGLTSQSGALLTAGSSPIQAVPEPSTLVLGGLALLGLAGVKLRRRRAVAC